MNNVLLAFGLTLFAGLSRGIGSAIGLFAKTMNTRLPAVSLRFSAGEMLYVSLVEILAKARDALGAAYGATPGVIRVLGAAGGSGRGGGTSPELEAGEGPGVAGQHHDSGLRLSTAWKRSKSRSLLYTQPPYSCASAPIIASVDKFPPIPACSRRAKKRSMLSADGDSSCA